MSEPTVRYRSRSTAAPAEAASDQPETRGVVASGVLVSHLPHGDTSPGSWGPHIADEDLDLVIRRLSPVRGQRPARGLRIEESMADRRGTKRPTEEDRRERLAKMANLGKGKGKAGTSAPPSQNVAPSATRATPAPSALATATATAPTPAPQTSRPPGFSRDDRQPARPDVHSSRTREDRPVAQSLAPRSAQGESRLNPTPLPPSQTSSTYRPWSRSSRSGLASRLSSPPSARTLSRLLTTASTSRLRPCASCCPVAEEARKEAEDRTKVAEERAKEAEGRQRFAEDLVQKADQAVEEAETSKAELEEALQRAEQELASARVEHERYVRVALHAALEEAQAQAVADFLRSEDFNERVAQMYRESMRDMKAGFTAANPSLVGVDWSFMPVEFEETVAEEPPEEGEVTDTARELGDVIILDDQVTEPEQPAPAESVQAAATAEPEPDQSATVVSADQE
ncbi:hypothetical protein TIFTF001_030454 [Ficus carica]|uniref:Uncharacterized protein n=1 Tax=Ficus carica TaxID=3494 RepID=A0AA88DT61_FICCA|nr:hypothetical protein TIFTF001_030454 [Ficus carica]